jgi:hypothetical protein
VTGSREKQSQEIGFLEKAMANMHAQLDSLQGSVSGMSTERKKCCIEETAFQNAIRDQTNTILAEVSDNII